MLTGIIVLYQNYILKRTLEEMIVQSRAMREQTDLGEMSAVGAVESANAAKAVLEETKKAESKPRETLMSLLPKTVKHLPPLSPRGRRL